MNAPWKPSGVAHRDPFLAHVCDDATADTLRGIAGELGWSPDKIGKGGLRQAIQTLSVSASPQILFVDLAESGDPLNDINALAEVCEPGTIVIAAGHVNDVRLYRDLIASGIQDYLLKPLHPDALRDAFAHAQALINAPRMIDAGTERAHCAVAVIGARGGVGATSTAVSLAWLLSDKQARSTALLDLDVHFGTGALALDLEPGRGLTDAIDNPSRIDGLFIERAMVKASETLSVLSAEAPINTPLITDGTAYYQLQEEIRAAFECTVIDLPRATLVQHPALMGDIQVAVVVTELSLAAARDTIRLLSWLKTNAAQARVVVVGNKMLPTSAEITRKDFETTIERKIDVAVPADGKLASQSAKLGKSFAELGKSGKLGVALNALAVQVIGAADESGAKPRTRGSLAGRIGALSSLLSKPRS